MNDLFDFEKPTYKIKNKIYLIELFGGIGSQAMALRDIGADFVHHRLVEFDKYCIKSYNSIHNTNFQTIDIRNLKGEDLGIVDTEHKTYIMTYSFPCQSISLAGKQAGMSKGSGTRSGLLWEVERLLNETENLPQVLLMENVPQVHSKKNMSDFEEWIKFLESKGYSNYYEDLNAKDYGIPQSRNRCFMVSILGDYSYTFPDKIPLSTRMRDYLENEVEEKFFIRNEKADKLLNELIEKGEIPIKEEVNIGQPSKFLGNYYGLNDGYDRSIFSTDGNVKTITASHGGIATILIESMPINETKDELCRTIKAQYYKNGLANLNEQGAFGCSGAVEIKIVGKMDHTLDHTFESANRVYDKNGICPTLPTCAGGNHQPKVIDIKVVGKLENTYDQSSRVYDSEGLSPTLTATGSTGGPIPHKVLVQKVGQVSNEGSQSGTVYATDGLSPNLCAGTHGYANGNIVCSFGIRKLTPRECWRLMGYNDKDFEKAQKVNSNTQLYKQAGNAIVKQCLMSIFKNLIEE